MMFNQEMMSQQTQPPVKGTAPTLKKSTATADTKKKWMRRI